MKKLLAATAFATLLAAGSAQAQEAPRPGPLALADANSDGAITREEFLADMDRRFAALDANNDGGISTAERGEGGRMMGRADTNEDGVISRDEQRAQATQRFDRLDANSDGKIDAAEREAMRARFRGGDNSPPAGN